MLVLAVGALLCLWGITFGLPHVYTPDEPAVVGRALVMARSGDLNPHFFTYPHLVYTLQAAVLRLTAYVLTAWPALIMRSPMLQDTGAYYLAARGLSTLCALVAIGCAYAMGRDLEGRAGTGLLAALFLAVAPVAVQHAHYATVDGPSATTAALCGYACLRALARSRRAVTAAVPAGGDADRTMCDHAPLSLVPPRHDAAWLGKSRGYLALGAVAAGLAAGTKYNAAVVLLCPLITAGVLWARARDAGLMPALWRLAAALLAVGILAAAAYLITTPYTVLDWPDFRGGVLGVARHYGETGHPGAEGNDNWRWYLGYLSGPSFGLPLTALALAGGVTGLLRRHAEYLVISAFVAAYFALLCSGYVRFERNLLPLLPFLAVLAASFTTNVSSALGRRMGRIATGVSLITIVLIAAVPLGITTAQQDEALTHVFTQTLALDWIVLHVPPGATIAVENWEAPPLPPSRYRLVPVSALGKHDLAWYHGQGVTYLVADSWTDGAYLRDIGHYAAEVAHYTQLFAAAQPLAHIYSGGQLAHPGPNFAIYRLPTIRKKIRPRTETRLLAFRSFKIPLILQHYSG